MTRLAATHRLATWGAGILFATVAASGVLSAVTAPAAHAAPRIPLPPVAGNPFLPTPAPTAPVFGPFPVHPTPSVHPTPAPAATPTPAPRPPLPPGFTPAPAPTPTPEAAQGGVLGGLFGNDSADLGNYDMGYDEGSWNSTNRKLWGFLTQIAWSWTTWMVGIAVWMVDWAFSFDLAQLLIGPANSLARIWQRSVVAHLGLPGFFLFCCAAWSGIQILFGRIQRGATEFGISLIVGAITTIVLANPGAMLLGDDGMLGKTRNLSLEVAAVAVAAPGTSAHPPAGTGAPASYHQVVKPLTDAIVNAFVVEPHMQLNWGQSLDDPTHPRPRCLAAYRQLVHDGPHGTSDEPRDVMTAAGCQDLAKFNHDIGPSRFGGAIAVAIAATLVVILMVILAGALAMAGVALAIHAVTAVWALLLGLLPGRGRTALWSWATGVAVSLGAVLGSVLFLVLFLTLSRGVLNATEGVPIMQRLFGLDFIVLASFVAFVRLRKAARRASERAVSTLAGMSSSGAGGAAGGHGLAFKPILGGAAGGAAAAELWNETRNEISKVTSVPGQAIRRGRAATGATVDAATKTGRGVKAVVTSRPVQSIVQPTGKALSKGVELTKDAGSTAYAYAGVKAGQVMEEGLPKVGRAAADASRATTQATKDRLLSARASRSLNLSDRSHTDRPRVTVSGPARPGATPMSRPVRDWRAASTKPNPTAISLDDAQRAADLLAQLSASPAPSDG